jgi:hypothetical protein
VSSCRLCTEELSGGVIYVTLQDRRNRWGIKSNALWLQRAQCYVLDSTTPLPPPPPTVRKTHSLSSASHHTLREGISTNFSSGWIKILASYFCVRSKSFWFLGTKWLLLNWHLNPMERLQARKTLPSWLQQVVGREKNTEWKWVIIWRSVPPLPHVYRWEVGSRSGCSEQTAEFFVWWLEHLRHRGQAATDQAAWEMNVFVVQVLSKFASPSVDLEGSFPKSRILNFNFNFYFDTENIYICLVITMKDRVVTYL